ncbi:YegJ family protein [Maribacter sp. IgM3_T14_3]|uniref:YegJ family protein n=1 Tax=Maribacter sp. IgM3_T14_3 TaxID=3415140 RepID=UPI003C6F5715
MKKSLLFIALILCILASCKEGSVDKTERSGEPDVYNVEDDDAKMNQAMVDAKNSIGEFKNALASDNPSFEYFTIKQKFNADGGAEHIWVGDIQLIDNDFMGIIANEPVYTSEVQLGDTITVNSAHISDWMYYDDGKVVGGYTIRVIRDALSPKEQAQFDAENGLTFK